MGMIRKAVDNTSTEEGTRTASGIESLNLS